MKRLRGRLRYLVGLGGLLVLGGIGFRTLADDPERRPPAANGADKRPAIELGDKVGRVIRVDPKTGDILIDFGRREGAEVGLRLDVWHPDPDGNAGGNPLGERVCTVELVSVADRESTARREVEPEEKEGGRPRREVRAGDDVLNATDIESFRVFKLATGDDPDAIGELRKVRVDRARRLLEVSKAFYENGVAMPDRYVDASRALMEAERDAASTRDAKGAAVRAHLVRMSRFADAAAARFADGQGSLTGLSEARLAQAEAALMLAESKRDPAGEPAAPAPRERSNPPKAEGAAPDRPRPLIGDDVGRVTKFDEGRGEVRIGFGRIQGAEVGMKLRVDPDFEAKEFENLDLPGRRLVSELTGRLEITSVDDREGVARVLSWGSREGGRNPGGREIRPGDRLTCDSEGEASRILKLGIEGGPDAVLELRRSVLRDARRWHEMARVYLENGTITGDRYFAASRALMEAERGESSSREREVAAILGHLKRLTSWIDRELNNFRLDHLSEPQLSEARSQQAEAALMLIKAKQSNKR